MTDSNHQRLLNNLDRLLQSWEDMRARLLEDAAVDRAEGLERTAEANEVGALGIKGCIRGLRDVVKENGE